MIRVCFLLALAPSALLFTPRLADACSAPRCVGGGVEPSAHGTVPANLPGLLWHPLVDATDADPAPDPSRVTLSRLTDPTPIPFTTRVLSDQDVLLVPAAPLVVGETYQLSDATTCGGSSAALDRSTFEVRAATPLPTTLGALAPSAQGIFTLDVPTPSGSCTAEVVAAQRTVWLRMDPGTDEWVDLLQLQTFVDDRPWGIATDAVRGPFGTRTVGATVQVYRTCLAMDDAADPGLAAGTHTIRVEATLPGTSVRVLSDTATFDLDCQGHGKDPKPAPDAGCNAAGAGARSWLAVVLGALVVRRRRRAAIAR